MPTLPINTPKHIVDFFERLWRAHEAEEYDIVCTLLLDLLVVLFKVDDIDTSIICDALMYCNIDVATPYFTNKLMPKMQQLWS